MSPWIPRAILGLKIASKLQPLFEPLLAPFLDRFGTHFEAQNRPPEASKSSLQKDDKKTSIFSNVIEALNLKIQ